MTFSLQNKYLLAMLDNLALAYKHGHKLWQMYPDLSDLFAMNAKDLAALGLNEAEIATLKNPNWGMVEENLRWAEESAHYLITFKDENFPPLLREIQNPPLLLFVAGNVASLNKLQLAVVGSRNPSPTGKESAHHFAYELAKLGIIITSGFARGIDAASHSGAIAARQSTIAVMGTGLKKIYPKVNTSLWQKILECEGALVSEFPVMTSALALNFPLRNRIISGLSHGTLIVEAALGSGSLITARYAAEQGREVFVIPGSIFNPLARGCHSLIRQGAKLVENVQDILEELPVQFTLPSVTRRASRKNNLDQDYNLLLECTGFEATSVDTLIARAGIPASKIGSMLVELELDGLLCKVPGGYCRHVKL
jgi:DNA processing protein